MKILGILGLDYSGSTMVTNVLSGISNSASIGESHWILDKNLGCKECFNKPCPIFTKDMLARLRRKELDDGEWWEIIAEYTKSDIIISSDKSPRIYERFGVPDYLLFLYKDPKANINSWCRRQFKDTINTSGYYSEDQINKGIAWWKKNTISIFDWLNDNISKNIAVLNLEDFCVNPYEGLAEISGWLGAEYDHTTVQFWTKDLHYIGGNHSVKRLSNEKFFYKSIKIDDRWKDKISPQCQSVIDEDEEIKEIINKIIQISNKTESHSYR